MNKAKNRLYQRHLLGCVFHSVYMNKRDNGSRDYNKLLLAVHDVFDEVTWASFNWDAKFEQAFFYAFDKEKATYRLPRCMEGLLEWEGTNPRHLLLKLHGSVGWFKGPGGAVLNRRFGSVDGRYPIADEWQSYLRNEEGASEPVIAEPSFFKHEKIRDFPFLMRQWRRFDKALGVADVVLVVGYSLPDGDAMAKQSLLTGVFRHPESNYLLVDPDSEGVVGSRYRRIVGANRLTTHPMGLSDFVLQPNLKGILWTRDT